MDNKQEITKEQMKQFYISAGVIVNSFCKYIGGFWKTSNYKNLLTPQLASESEILKENLQRYFIRFTNKIDIEDNTFRIAMLDIVNYGHFSISTSYYIENFAEDYLLSARLGNKFGVGKLDNSYGVLEEV